MANHHLDEPTFTDLEPRSAGSSGDGYVWKYLYTIKPTEVVKFESTDLHAGSCKLVIII